MAPVRPDPVAVLTWRRLLTYVRWATTTLDHELQRDRGMPLAEYDVLFQLSEGPSDGMRMSTLADALLVAPSSCTRLVGTLVERGWVRRTSDPSDGRVVVAALTPAGRAALTRASVVHLRGIEAHFSALLDPATRRGLDAALDRLEWASSPPG